MTERPMCEGVVEATNDQIALEICPAKKLMTFYGTAPKTL